MMGPWPAPPKDAPHPDLGPEPDPGLTEEELRDIRIDDIVALVGRLQSITDQHLRAHIRAQEALLSEITAQLRDLKPAAQLCDLKPAASCVSEEAAETKSPAAQSSPAFTDPQSTPDHALRPSPRLSCDSLGTPPLQNPSVRPESFRFQDHKKRKHPGSGFLLYGYWLRARLWLAQIEEPPRTGHAFWLLQHKLFEMTTLLVILLNGVFLVYLTNRAVQEGGGESSSVAVAVEFAFLMYYTLELALKFWVHRLYFFANDDSRWNTFDLVVVMISLGDLTIGNVSFLRVLRVLRLGKSLRMFRALKMVKELRLLIDSMLGSVSSLFWCLILLLLISVVFSLFIVQSLKDFILEEHSGAEARVEGAIVDSFGSVQQSMLTLFKATSGSDAWSIYYDMLLQVGWLPAATFIVYILFFSIAAWNIVSSIFIEKVLALAQPDMDQQYMEKQRKLMTDAKELEVLLTQVDRDGSGGLTLEEYRSLMEDPRCSYFFELHGLSIGDGERIFAMLRAGTGEREVDIPMFVASCLGMRGTASSADMSAVSFELRTMHRRQRAVSERLELELSRIGAALDGLRMASAVPMARPVLAKDAALLGPPASWWGRCVSF